MGEALDQAALPPPHSLRIQTDALQSEPKDPVELCSPVPGHLQYPRRAHRSSK